MKEKTKNSTTNTNTEDKIDILSAIFLFLHHWRLILVVVLIALMVGVCYTFITPKKYLATTSILLTEEGSGNKGSSGNFDLESIGLLTTTNNIDNEIALLSSPDIMLQVVNDLKLHYSYYIKDKFREIDIYRNSPYLVKLDNDSVLLGTGIEFSIVKKDNRYYIDGKYSEYSEWHNFSKEADSLPVIISLLGTSLKIDAAQESVKTQINSLEIFVKINSPVGIADRYASRLEISTVTKYASTLYLKTISENPEKGKDMLAKLIQVYNVDNVNDKNKMALNTAIFINERIADIGVELGDVEKDVENFKKTQGITDLSNDAHIYMERSSLADGRLVEIETQIKIIEMIESFVKKSDNEVTPIPNIGLTDPGLSTSIIDYNNKLLNYNSILSTTSVENPTRERILIELKMQRESIFDLVKSAKSSLQISKFNIEKQLNLNLSKIKSLPSLERGLIEKMRQQQIKENLYLFLLQKREESNITMASTSDKAKIVIKPRSSSTPIVPSNRVILLVSIVIGLIASIIIIYIKQLLRNKIESKEELDKLSDALVLGSIIKNESNESIVVNKDTNTPISELFRYLRNNIEFILENQKHKVILVASTIAGEGKTFIAANLACAYSLNYKKVLLVGMDIRNPQIANAMNIPKQHGLTDYIAGSRDSWKELIVTSKNNPGLDILQAGTIPPNPNELLKSKRIKEFIEEVKVEYDVVILDSAPLGIISDTYALCQYSDFTLYVIRENTSLKSSVNFINEQYNSGRFSNMYLVLNDSNPQNGSYKYYGAKAYGYSK